MFADDPKRNQDNVPWAESINGIALRQLGWYSLPDKYVNQPMTNVSRREPTGPTTGSVHCRVPVTKPTQVCTACLVLDAHTHSCETCNINAILNEPNGQYAYVPMSILLLQEGSEDEVVELLAEPEDIAVDKVDTLIDTGACANFISKSFSNQLKAAGVVITTDKNNYKRKVYEGIKNACSVPEGDLIFSLTFVSESKKLLQFSLRSTIVETQVDLIIGLPTIRQLNLLRHMPSRFFSGEVLTKMLTGLGPVEKTLRILEEKAERLYTLSSGSSCG